MTHTPSGLPRIIQGGMGIGVSDYRLARAVSRAGGLGVVSGTAIDTVVVRRLQLGDAEGDVRRALSAFPFRHVAERLIDTYFVPGGKAPSAPFRLLPLPKVTMGARRLEAIVAANFVEVFLAKEGHDGPIGINYLEKIQLPTLPSLLGAILAGVDVVLMGAGIPTQIPGTLDKFASWQAAELRASVADRTDPDPILQRLDPAALFGDQPFPLRRPSFLGIVSSHVVAKSLAKKASGRVDGFVVEDHTAGGHNAPPRKKAGASSGADGGYGPLDAPDLAAFRALELPFWLAGSAGNPDAVRAALARGAAGVQVGTAFAYCEESAIRPDIKRDVLERASQGRVAVETDFEASPTGYPFKRVVREGLGGELEALRARERVCDLGYLRQTAWHEGKIVYRCPAEPPDAFAAKGGAPADTAHKLCLCNQLLATVGLGQARDEGEELPLLTAGERIDEITRFLKPGQSSYSAADVLSVLRRAAEPHPEVAAAGDVHASPP